FRSQQTMNKRLQKMLAERVKTLAAMRSMLEAAETAGVELTEEQGTQYATHETALKALDEKIAREKRLIEAERGAPAAADPRITDVRNRAGDQPYNSLGEQLFD